MDHKALISSLSPDHRAALLAKSNRAGFRHLAMHWGLIATLGGLISLGVPGWQVLVVPQGVLIIFCFTLQHECVHYTVFRTRWLNDFVGQICGLIIILPHRFFRYEHCDHHTYTQLKGQDPELIELPISVWKYLWYISSVPYWKNKFNQIFRNGAGRLNADDRTFITKHEAPIIFREARVMLVIYAAIALVCFTTTWTGPLWFWTAQRGGCLTDLTMSRIAQRSAISSTYCLRSAVSKRA